MGIQGTSFKIHAVNLERFFKLKPDAILFCLNENDFTIDKNGNYTGHITVKMEDGFGLDVHDVDSKGGLHPGFMAWWLLQHTRGYKPFTTKMEVTTTISGNINSP